MWRARRSDTTQACTVGKLRLGHMKPSARQLSMTFGEDGPPAPILATVLGGGRRGAEVPCRESASALRHLHPSPQPVNELARVTTKSGHSTRRVAANLSHVGQASIWAAKLPRTARSLSRPGLPQRIHIKARLDLSFARSTAAEEGREQAASNGTGVAPFVLCFSQNGGCGRRQIGASTSFADMGMLVAGFSEAQVVVNGVEGVCVLPSSCAATVAAMLMFAGDIRVIA